MNEMVELDNLYVQGWSPWLDVKILLRTLDFVVTRRGL
jgi:lipopolysaccharide/colanic/teichoic acid biosynthesis glycosyltransferase